MTRETSFFQNYIQGDASNDDITNAIAEWHEDPQGTELHEYLGPRTTMREELVGPVGRRSVRQERVRA